MRSKERERKTERIWRKRAEYIRRGTAKVDKLLSLEERRTRQNSHGIKEDETGGERKRNGLGEIKVENIRTKIGQWYVWREDKGMEMKSRGEEE